MLPILPVVSSWKQLISIVWSNLFEFTNKFKICRSSAVIMNSNSTSCAYMSLQKKFKIMNYCPEASQLVVHHPPGCIHPTRSFCKTYTWSVCWRFWEQTDAPDKTQINVRHCLLLKVQMAGNQTCSFDSQIRDT